ncbi:hypothetical protein KIN20_031414 [Parelaphostrongylus tenuis]|uniref:Chromo domain-containing protein n=1 Tax=Parelaphostrongylus tenuis TaxID=148309 RepID=A0AAD5R538_PARTN|nr:hypothetical protein KIN20_031414 [Parelaphostrongylus tenuis]
MPLPWNYEDRLWITKILGHMTYEEAYRQRHEIAFRPNKEDRTANIHNQWVFKVEWELFNGEFIQTWEIEDRLVHLKELDIYKERNNIIEERSRIFTRYRWTSSEEDSEADVSDEDTVTS